MIFIIRTTSWLIVVYAYCYAVISVSSVAGDNIDQLHFHIDYDGYRMFNGWQGGWQSARLPPVTAAGAPCLVIAIETFCNPTMRGITSPGILWVVLLSLIPTDAKLRVKLCWTLEINIYKELFWICLEEQTNKDFSQLIRHNWRINMDEIGYIFITNGLPQFWFICPIQWVRRHRKPSKPHWS